MDYDYSSVLAEAIGEEQGLSPDQIFSFQSRVDEAHRRLMEWKEAGKIGFIDLPEKEDEARTIAEMAGKKRKGMDACLVLGIGGSSLGGKALRDAVKTPLYNEMPP